MESKEQQLFEMDERLGRLENEISGLVYRMELKGGVDIETKGLEFKLESLLMDRFELARKRKQLVDDTLVDSPSALSSPPPQEQEQMQLLCKPKKLMKRSEHPVPVSHWEVRQTELEARVVKLEGFMVQSIRWLNGIDENLDRITRRLEQMERLNDCLNDLGLK